MAVPEPVQTRGLVTITIDDGWRSTQTNILPILDEAGFKITSYVITWYLDHLHPEFLGPAEVQELQSRGHEVGAHTRGHLDLTKLPPEQARFEIVASKQDLLKAGIREVRSFSYPFGEYNPSIVEMVRSAGYESARTTDRGFNKNPDPFLLRYQELKRGTALSEVRSWVDEAIATRQWLILLAHHIDGTPTEFSITPQFFREVVNYLVSTKVRVVTVSQGLTMTP